MLSLKTTTYDVSAVGPTPIVPPWNSNSIRIWGLFMWNLAAQTIDFCDANAVSLTGYLDSFPAKSGKLIPIATKPYWELAAGSGLYLRTSGGTRVTGYVVASAPGPNEVMRDDLASAADVSVSVNTIGGSGGSAKEIDYAALGAAVASAMQRQMDTLAIILQNFLGGK